MGVYKRIIALCIVACMFVAYAPVSLAEGKSALEQGILPMRMNAMPSADIAAKPTAAPTATQAPAPLAAKYVEMLKSGTYQYSYIVPYEGIEMTTTEAAKGGDAVYRVSLGETGSRFLQKGGTCYAINDKTGEAAETTAEKNPGGELDFRAMAFIDSEERDGMVFEKYSMLRNAREQTFTFVFEGKKPIGLAFSYVESDAPYFEMTEFTGTVEESLFEFEPETLRYSEDVYLLDAAGDNYTAESVLDMGHVVDNALITRAGNSYQSGFYVGSYTLSAGSTAENFTIEDRHFGSFDVEMELDGRYSGFSMVVAPSYVLSALGNAYVGTVEVYVDSKPQQGIMVNGNDDDLPVQIDLRGNSTLRIQASGTSLCIFNPYFTLSNIEAPEANTTQVLWTNGNQDAVENGARDYYVEFALPACTVTELETYHYKSGGKKPGQLMLFGADGSEYGPFKAVGRDAQDGVKNAYWVATVNIDLPAGSYAIADSDESTWSSNAKTDGWGIATVRGILKEQTAAASGNAETAVLQANGYVTLDFPNDSTVHYVEFTAPKDGYYTIWSDGVGSFDPAASVGESRDSADFGSYDDESGKHFKMQLELGKGQTVIITCKLKSGSGDIIVCAKME